jgi:hypothetical protein
VPFLKENTYTQKRHFGKFKKLAQMGILALKKANTLGVGGKRMYSSYCTHIYISCGHQFMPDSGFAVNGIFLVPVKHRK